MGESPISLGAAPLRMGALPIWLGALTSRMGAFRSRIGAFPKSLAMARRPLRTGAFCSGAAYSRISIDATLPPSRR